MGPTDYQLRQAIGFVAKVGFAPATYGRLAPRSWFAITMPSAATARGGIAAQRAAAAHFAIMASAKSAVFSAGRPPCTPSLPSQRGAGCHRTRCGSQALVTCQRRSWSRRAHSGSVHHSPSRSYCRRTTRPFRWQSRFPSGRRCSANAVRHASISMHSQCTSCRLELPRASPRQSSRQHSAAAAATRVCCRVAPPPPPQWCSPSREASARTTTRLGYHRGHTRRLCGHWGRTWHWGHCCSGTSVSRTPRWCGRRSR